MPRKPASKPAANGVSTWGRATGVTYDGRKIYIDVKGTVGVPFRVRVDRKTLAQIVVNMIERSVA